MEKIKQHPTEFTYSVIVITSTAISVTNISNPLLTFDVLRTVRSGSNTSSYLSLIEVKTFTDPSYVINYFSEIGIQISKENSFFYLSLTKINISHLIDDNILDNKHDFSLAQENLLPKKFLKFLKREELLFERKLNLSNNNNNNQRSILLFRNMNFSISFDSLRPRDSSVIIIETAVKYLSNELKIQNKNYLKQRLRILDLGTGPGTLLLTIILELFEYCSMQSIPMPIIEATGIDINIDALSDAKLNEKSLRSLKFDEKFQIYWIQCDYNNLYGQSADINVHNNYNVIVCNPPYLSEEAAKGRVTAENKDCLVSGTTGLEDYQG
jgi:methylase of polypeptide subunit release factors